MRLPKKSVIATLLGKTTLKDLQYLRNAIVVGDTLPNKGGRPPPPRRALIVTPTYQNDSQHQKMGNTIRDARLIHQLLVGQYEYEPANIRILSDAFRVDDLGHHTYPTRQNVLESLKWLVDAKAGDHRFFHFSGHGHSRKTKQGEGKLARTLPEWCASEEDTEYRPSGRTTSMTIKRTDIAYYNEEIVTTLDVRTKDNQQCVTDRELNKEFSELPAECRLTCLLDCCYSGRMIDNAIKLAGSGFRGSAPHQAASSAASEDLPADTDNTSDVTYDEELPEEEQTRDTIKAQTLTWGASHQRQRAAYHITRGCGLLTGFFTTYLKRTPKITVEELHKLVEFSVGFVNKKRWSDNLQYVQLRMSPKTADDTKQREVMEAQVDI